VNASETYARNILDFLGLLIDDGALAPRWDDEIVTASLLTRDGVVVHEPTRAALDEFAVAPAKHHERDDRPGGDAKEAP
jgi:hypothetical protein